MRRSLGTTLKRLKALSPPLIETARRAAGENDRLTELERFGSNPGALKAFTWLPASSAALPLVVVLHGCTQTAAGYDHGSGWSTLAERHGFALLFPEQQRSNNPNLCFNWFSPADIRRGAGETLSIKQMIATLIARGEVDPARVYITGLSAGGAMTSAMLATYPELFAGGAIIAGLPFGAAASVPEAFERMRGEGHPSSDAYADMVRKASHQHRGAWPRISVWHGTADGTVAFRNADAIIGQWRSLHSVAERPDEVHKVNGFPHRIWRDAKGDVAIEEYEVTGMGHGTPLKTRGDDGLGAAIPHMLDVGISSTRRIAEGWGLVKPGVAGVRQALGSHKQASHGEQPSVPVGAASGSVQGVIESALRAAGLMR